MDPSAGRGPTGALPRPLTPLVGREQQVAEIVALVRHADVRLVTLTGPGGIGKTRLAVATADEVEADFPGGRWFADLASVTDPALVVPTIAGSMGLRDAGAESAAGWITAFARDRRILLVLDNIEQVVDAAPALVHLLAETPGLRMLATSRIRLRVTGEHAYPVPPLGLPGPMTVSGPAGAPASVALFIERAKAVEPGFQVGPDDGPAVDAICRRLDGLPLAIELAAARMTMFTPAALLSRLERQMPVLTGGARDLPERQQTMRNAIAWSYDLLSGDERRLLPRLCVFAGGFVLEAAEAVGAVGEPVGDVVSALNGLIDQSLVRRLDPVVGESRFGVLETVREFGSVRLADAGEAPLAAAALVDWVIGLLERAATGLMDYPQQAAWRAILDAELGNLRAAIAWLDAAGQHAEVLRLLGSTEEYWWSERPYQAEISRWIERALTGGMTADPHTRAAALHLAVLLASSVGQQVAGAGYAEQEIEIGRATNDSFLLGRGLFDLAVTWEFRDDPQAALALYAEALPYLREAGRPIWLGQLLSELGDKHVVIGSVEEAVPFFDEALALMRQEAHPWGLAMVQGERGFAALAMGRPVDAARLFEDSFRSSRGMSDDHLEQRAVAGLAGVALGLGRLEQAAKVLGAVEAARIASGLTRPVQPMHLRPIRERIRVQLGEAAFERAMDAGWAMSLDEVVSDVLRLVEAQGQTAPEPAVNNEARLLTPREAEVLRLLVQGRTDREIADALFIGSRTVQTHVSNLLAKLEVGNRAEAAAVAVRRGLV